MEERNPLMATSDFVESLAGFYCCMKMVLNDQVTTLQRSSAVSALDQIGWPSKGGITIRLKAKSNLVLMA